MKIKLDENVDIRVIPLLRQVGHDVMTVKEQGLISTPDENLIEVCRLEERCLITADRGFGNCLKYNPANYSGIIIICLPAQSSFEDWRKAIETLVQGLKRTEVIGKLWIIRQGKIQEYEAIEIEEED